MVDKNGKEVKVGDRVAYYFRPLDQWIVDRIVKIKHDCIAMTTRYINPSNEIINLEDERELIQFLLER